jgi:CRP-like cAMP-binding protein
VEDPRRKTEALHSAAKQGDVALAKRSIEEYADVNEVNREKHAVVTTHDKKEVADMKLKLMRNRILRTPLVKTLPEGMRQRFAMILLWVSETKDVSRRDKLFVEGDKDTGTGCVILDGMVEVRTEDNPEAVKCIEAPDILGEVQLFTPQGQRTATLEVVVPGTILTFAWHDLGAAARQFYSDEEMATLKRVITESAWRREENLFEKVMNR